jgi:hypothetical protein
MEDRRMATAEDQRDRGATRETAGDDPPPRPRPRGRRPTLWRAPGVVVLTAPRAAGRERDAHPDLVADDPPATTD